MSVNPEVAPVLTPILPPYDEKNDRRFRDDGTFYLIRYNGRRYAGTVEKQWYGWNFNMVYDAGLQMSHGIEACYEIAGKATRAEPIFEILTAAAMDVGLIDNGASE